jgi:hypothetical protein
MRKENIIHQKQSDEKKGNQNSSIFSKTQSGALSPFASVISGSVQSKTVDISSIKTSTLKTSSPVTNTIDSSFTLEELAHIFQSPAFRLPFSPGYPFPAYLWSQQSVLFLRNFQMRMIYEKEILKEKNKKKQKSLDNDVDKEEGMDKIEGV